MKTRNILIVGAGGIGSWMAPDLARLVEYNQIQDDIIITYADDDVIDTKNLAYQNFKKSDILDNKVEIISSRYGFIGLNKRILKNTDLKGYDCIVSAVDNTDFRELLFKYAEKNPDIYWIDLRSEGKSFAVFTKNKANDLETMLKTLPSKVENGSCQLEYELANNIIQRGNILAAAYGVSCILNWIRGDFNPPKFIHSI